MLLMHVASYCFSVEFLRLWAFYLLPCPLDAQLCFFFDCSIGDARRCASGNVSVYGSRTTELHPAVGNISMSVVECNITRDVYLV
jgi:hypothetical protein